MSPRGWNLPFLQQIQHFLGNFQAPGVNGRLIIDVSGAGASLRNSVRHRERFFNFIFVLNTTEFPLSVSLGPSGSPSLLPVLLSQRFPGAFLEGLWR